MTTLSAETNILQKDDEENDMNHKEQKAWPSEIHSTTGEGKIRDMVEKVERIEDINAVHDWFVEKIPEMEEKTNRLDDLDEEHDWLVRCIAIQNPGYPETAITNSDGTRIAEQLEGNTECCNECCIECNCVIS